MLSLRICKHSMGKLMIEVLKMVKKCKIYQNRRSQEVWPEEFDQKICSGARNLDVFENLPGGCLGGGMVTLGTD